MTLRAMLVALTKEHRPDLSLGQCELVAMQAVGIVFPAGTNLLDTSLTIEEQNHLRRVYVKQFKNGKACKKLLASVISQN